MTSAAHASLASAAYTSLAARYEQPSPPRFTAFGVDLERPGALELVTRQIAHQREIILVCGDAAPTAGSATHLNTSTPCTEAASAACPGAPRALYPS